MRMEIWKKVVAGVAVCSLVAGVASAVKWEPPGTPVQAYWDNPLNWDDGAVPSSDEKTQMSSSVTTECIVTNNVVSGQLVMGDGGLNYGVKFRITDSGILNACNTGGNWSGVGYSRDTYCIVEAGGVFNNGNRLGIGMKSPGVALFDVYGEVNIEGALQVGAGGGDGTVMLYQGGTISATHLETGDDALIDIWQTGELFFSDVVSNELTTSIADGEILGNRLTNNLNIVWGIVDPGTTNAVTNATITAIDSIPNLAGLSTNEAADVLAVFGYTVGAITEGSAPGGITGLVAAQVPAAGTAPQAPGFSIDLMIQEAGEIPNVVGLDYDDATAVILASGFIVGTETSTYVFDVTPGLVTAQDPAGGVEATPGDPVNIGFNERLAAESTVIATIPGDWMSFIWQTDSVNVDPPVRETQNYQVQIPGGSTVTLTNFVAMRRLHQGHNGGPAIAQLDVMPGAHLVAGMFGNYLAVGWNADAVLNVYGMVESRNNLRVGWNGSSSTINIDGGSVSADSYLSLGRSTQTNDVGVVYESEITIKNGGSLLVDYLRGEGYDYGHITLEEGTFTTTGTSTDDIDEGLASGLIVIAEGYSSLVSTNTGDAILYSYLPGYASWSGINGVGTENQDEDEDLRDNLYEYALNGDPNDPLDLGEDPVMTDLSGSLEYTHLMRHDDTNLVYSVETTTDLVNVPFAAIGYTVAVGTNVTGDAYDVVTNHVPTTADEIFIRLKVTNP
jgi:hypothetical protein